MNVPLKAVVIGLALAALIVVSHLLFPVLLVVLLLGLIRRVWFGSRWDFACDGWGSMRRHGPGASWSRSMPSIDGGPARRVHGYSGHDQWSRSRDVPSI